MAAGDLTGTVGNTNQHGAYFDGVDDKIDLDFGINPKIDSYSISVTYQSPEIVTSNDYSGQQSLWTTDVAGSAPLFYLSLRNSVVHGRFIGTGGVQDVTLTGINQEVGVKKTILMHINKSTGKIKYFNNGVASSESVAVTLENTTNQKIGIGWGDGTAFFKGIILSFKVWERLLTDDEAVDDANGILITNMLVHYYKLKEDAKDSIGDKDGTVTGALFAGQSLTTDVPIAVNDMNLATTTDKLICVPISGTDGKVSIFGVNREA